MCFAFSNGRRGRKFVIHFDRFCVEWIGRHHRPKQSKAGSWVDWLGQLSSEGRIGSTSWLPPTGNRLFPPRWTSHGARAPRVRATPWHRYLYHPPAVVSTSTSSACYLSESDNTNTVFPPRAHPQSSLGNALHGTLFVYASHPSGFILDVDRMHTILANTGSPSHFPQFGPPRSMSRIQPS